MPPVDSASRFVLFGPLHWTILAVTLGLPWLMARCTRYEARPRLANVLAAVVAAVLLADYFFTLTWAVHVGKIVRWEEALPLQLCDWASAAIVVALLTRRQQPFELAYYWGLSGTVQALLTPDVSTVFPNPLFIAFFVSHCGIVVGVLYLVWGFGLRPRRGSVGKAWLWSQGYLACAGVSNWTLHTNFGYLAKKPPHASLLDYFGPWPWYLLTLEVMALVFFGLFYLPIYLGRRRRETTLAPAAP